MDASSSTPAILFRKAFALFGGFTVACIAGCAPVKQAPSEAPPPRETRLEAALRDLELNHPRLTAVERETLHRRVGFHSSLKQRPDGTAYYSFDWIAGDHKVDVSGTGSLSRITTAEVRRFATGH